MSRLKDYKYELSIDQEKKLKRVFKVYEDRQEQQNWEIFWKE